MIFSNVLMYAQCSTVLAHRRALSSEVAMLKFGLFCAMQEVIKVNKLRFRKTRFLQDISY